MFDIVDTARKIRLFPLDAESEAPHPERAEDRGSIIDGGRSSHEGFEARWWPCNHPFDPLPEPDENVRRLRAKPR